MNSKFTQSSDGYYSTTEQTTGSAIVAPHVWIRVLLRGGGKLDFCCIIDDCCWYSVNG